MNYTIKYVANMTGLSEHRIRAWEKRYQLLKPDRTSKGRRLYSEADIEKLNMVKNLIDAGDKIGQIAHLSLEQLKNDQSPEKPYGKSINVAFQKYSKQELSLKRFILLQALSDHRVDIINHELKFDLAYDRQQYINEIIIPFFKELNHNKQLASSRVRLLNLMITNHLRSLFYNERERLGVPDKADVVVVSTSETQGEVDSWVCALRFLLNGTAVVHLGVICQGEVLRSFAQSYKPKSIVVTERVDSPAKEMRVEELLQEAFQSAGESLMPDLEILLLLQGMANSTRHPVLNGKARLQAFDSFDSINKHMVASHHSEVRWSTPA